MQTVAMASDLYNYNFSICSTMYYNHLFPDIFTIHYISFHLIFSSVHILYIAGSVVFVNFCTYKNTYAVQFYNKYKMHTMDNDRIIVSAVSHDY